MNFSAPYILLLGFYGFMAWWYHAAKSSKSHTWNIIICMVVTLIFWGFRGFIFYDWMSYYPLFQVINLNDISNSNIWSIEPGFTILIIVCKMIFNNFHFFVFTCSLINLLLLSRFLIKHIDNIPLGLIVFTIFGGLFFMTDLMRNALAVLIFINGIDYIKQRRCLPFIGICILSSSFHFSAILYLPLYFFLHLRINKYILAAIFFVCCIIFVLHIPVFSESLSLVLKIISPELEEKLRFYLLENANSKPGIDIVFLERCFTFILVFFYIDKLRLLRKDADIYINSLCLYFIFAFFFSEFVTFSIRLSLLFSFGYWIIWNDLIKCFSFQNNKKIFILFICMYCMLRIYGLTKSILAKYDNILFNSETYQIRQSMFNKNFKDQ